MTKQNFIALADAIREHNRTAKEGAAFTPQTIETLAQFCAGQNPLFKRDRWLAYVAGECGKNGGRVKTTAQDMGHRAARVWAGSGSTIKAVR